MACGSVHRRRRSILPSVWTGYSGESLAAYRTKTHAMALAPGDYVIGATFKRGRWRVARLLRESHDHWRDNVRRYSRLRYSAWAAISAQFFPRFRRRHFRIHL